MDEEAITAIGHPYGTPYVSIAESTARSVPATRLVRAFTAVRHLPLPKELILIHPIITTISTLRSPAYVKTCFLPDSYRVC